MRTPEKEWTRKQVMQDEGSSVWIVFDQQYIDPIPTVVDLSMKDESGDLRNEKIPMTWVPIDLSAYFSKESILKDNNVRRLEREGVIRFVHPEEAQMILNSTEAKEEWSLVSAKISKRGTAVQVEETNNPHIQRFLHDATVSRAEMERYLRFTPLEKRDVASIERCNNITLKEAFNTLKEKGEIKLAAA